MKRILASLISLAVVSVLFLGVIPALAKPDKNNNNNNEVKIVGNGFPSGPHYNLNIHGKQDGFACPEATSDNNSVFIPMEGTTEIQYVQNKAKGKAELEYQLKILDNCGFDGDGDVTIQLPFEQSGYYVYARILGKPNNNPNKAPSEVILWPNEFIEYCDNVGAENTSCSQALSPIGLVVGDNVYGVGDNQTFQRFDPNSPVKGKGRSLATEITRMFTYTGVVADNITDIDFDGVLTDADVPDSSNATAIVKWFSDNLTSISFPGPDYYDALNTKIDCNGQVLAQGDGSGDVDTIEEWLMFLADLWYYKDNATLLGLLADPGNPLPWPSLLVPVRVEFYCEEFMLNIADLVLIGQDLENKNTRLLQIRFYPVDTTTFPHE